MVAFPIIAVVTLIERGNEYLMLNRNKEPFHGFWGLPGSKLSSTDYILEGAVKALTEDTGLDCDAQLKGLFSSKTFIGNEFAYNHQLFVIHATNPRGTLIETTKKGAYTWVHKDAIQELKRR